MITLYLLLRAAIAIFKGVIWLFIGVIAFLACGLYFAVIAVVLLAVLVQVGRKFYWDRQAAKYQSGKHAS